MSCDEPAQGPSSSLFYGKTMLAPMVRVCSLGFRQLCSACAADVVFSEEVVAAKLRGSRRELRSYLLPNDEPNATTGAPRRADAFESIVEYVVYEPFKRSLKRAVVFAVPLARSAPVVLQLGAAEPAVAAEAAALCCEDVDGIDVNMGCPKKFSVSNGFGAALMAEPARAAAIIRAIYDRVNSAEKRSARGGRLVPVSFKTRLVDRQDASATVQMLQEILAAAGHTAEVPIVHAITLHARVRDQRSEEPPLLAVAEEVAHQCRLRPELANVCLVLNGSIASRADGEALCQRTGFDACMLARAALEDPISVFQHDTGSSDGADLGEAHHMESMKQLLVYAVRYRTEFKNFKYHLTRAFPEVPSLKPRMPEVQTGLRGYEDCFTFFHLSDSERAMMRRWEWGVELVDADHAGPSPPLGDEQGRDSICQETVAKRARVEA